MELGQRIKIVRKNCGITQKNLSELSGIAEPTIRSYESGRLNPKRETIQKISKALRISENVINGVQPFPDPFLEDTERLYAVVDKIESDCNIPKLKRIPGSFSRFCSRIEEYAAFIEFDDDGFVDIAYRKGRGPEENKINDDHGTSRELFTWRRLEHVFGSLNEYGQSKVIDYAKDLAKIPEYQKGFKE